MLFPLLVTPPAIWGGFALWYRAPGGRAARTLCAAVWWVFCGIALVAMGTGHPAVGAALLAVGLSVLLAWWLRLRPTHDRIWA
ncbi:MAG: hypothetical protein M3O06_07865, partial [Pseudomonadota bacterium]|nr:hypothetical protein [Pseudomonadota bacterium]